FHPGMLFKSPRKWWGDGGQRDFPHEGIDFCLYQDSSGNLKRLGPETRIPVLHDGVVRRVFADYLGQTLLVEHEPSPSEAGKRISFYAHIRPLNGVKPGVRLKQGDPLATIADTRRSKAKILPHLHYSLGAASAGLVYDGFVWNHMRNPDWVKLLDPLPLLDWRHRIVDQRVSDLGEIFHVTRQ
ncbi:MAG: M23 family metallopeptidase, partial [Desulfobacterales bacterium]